MDFSFRDALNTLQSDLSPAPSPEEPQETENSSDPLQDIWDTLDGNTDAEKDGNIDVEKDGNIDVSELLS